MFYDQTLDDYLYGRAEEYDGATHHPYVDENFFIFPKDPWPVTPKSILDEIIAEMEEELYGLDNIYDNVYDDELLGYGYGGDTGILNLRSHHLLSCPDKTRRLEA